MAQRLATSPLPNALRRPILETPPEKSIKLERRLSLAVTILPFLGALVGIPLFWGKGVEALDLTLFFVFYCISGMGVTVGFHRMLTHRSFEAPKWLRVTLAVLGSLAVQGPVIRWVADHRRHHAYADRPGDPHSPHLDEAEGVKGVLRGLWHAHMGWFFDAERTNARKFAPDLVADPALVKVNKAFPWLTFASFTLPAMIGLAITQTWSGMVTAFVWGSLFRVFFLHHVTWSINSLCHFYGKRPFESRDLSTNNWPLALVSFGEGWHNSHHAFPTSYRHGLERGQFDPSAWVIRGFEKLGWARNIRQPSPEQMEAKRIAAARAAADELENERLKEVQS
ncbi:MAG: acyl-CoA desaturase [Actinomycetota bacterium]|nr:acyl-CoA desaturase [Actinomycetota bacterium]